MRNDKGFTLVEMMVAMSIFMGILIIATYGFERVLNNSSQQARSAQSNFEGVVGLEMLRYDIEHAGYGLAYGFQNYSGTIQFRNLGGTPNQEVAVAANVPMNGMNSTTLNAVMSRDIHPFSAGTSTKEVNGSDVVNPAGGPDYLVMRSTISALDDASRKWTYVNYSTNSATNDNLSYLKRWGNADDLSSADRFITVKSSFTDAGVETKTLLMEEATDNFEASLTGGGALPSGEAFKPSTKSEVVVAYGIRSTSGSALRMPYNRTDYYVARPTANMPQSCNPGTGILYKAMVDHATGAFGTSYPLLDCVGDMQLEFEYDANESGIIPSPLDPVGFNALSADDIRSHLKTVRVYILTHEGKMDRNYTYPQDSIQVGDPSRPTTSGRTLTSSNMATLFTTDWRKYRWKIYTMIIRPKNLGR